jgi:hypothetical protein
MSKDDDSRLRFLDGGENAVTVRVDEAQHVAESLLSRVIAEHFYIDSRGITLAKTGGKLHFGVLRIVVPDEAANESNNDYLPVHRIRYRRRHRLAVCGAQGHKAGCGENKQAPDKPPVLAFSHATASQP